MADPNEKVVVKDPTLSADGKLKAETTSDSTPTGLSALSGSSPEKLKGTEAAERGTMTDLQKDADHVINLGGGNDIFVFASNSPDSDLNGIVDMGTGDADTVYMSFQMSDYAFTLRSDGGIKIEYIGGVHETGKGDAVTFRNADKFVFRNFDDVDHTNYANTELNHDALVALIQDAA